MYRCVIQLHKRLTTVEVPFVTREAKQKNSIANSASTSFKRQTAVLEIVKIIRANVHIVHPRIHHEDTLNSDIVTNPIFSSVFVIMRL